MVYPVNSSVGVAYRRQHAWRVSGVRPDTDEVLVEGIASLSGPNLAKAIQAAS
jgi:hypothetical protein